MKPTYYALVQFVTPKGTEEEFWVECIGADSEEACRSQLTQNGYKIYAIFAEEQANQLAADLDIDLTDLA